MINNWFVYLIIGLQIGASLLYIFHAEYRLSVYWAACAAVNIVVTY